MHKWFWIIGWFPTIMAVAGNAVVIWLIITKRRLRTTANWFVTSLAAADFFIGIFFFPTLYTCKIRWSLCSSQKGHVITILLSFLLHASVGNLCAMTIDRYVAITLPLKYIVYMTPKRSFPMIAATWIFPAAVWILHTVIVTYFGASATAFAVTVVRKCVLEFLPMIFLTLATIHMLVIVRRHKKEISSLLADLQYNRPISDEKPKIFRRIPEASSATVVAVVVFIFVFCYSIETYLFFCTVCPSALIDVVLFFFLLNAAANPLAYAFLKKDIRRELRKVFRDNCFHRKVVSHK